MSTKKDKAVEGPQFVEFLPALVLPAKASTEAGTEAGTQTSIYQGLRGEALMKEDARRNSFSYKAIRAVLCLAGGLFLGLLALALLAY